MKKYFIEITYYVPRNNLEERLHEEFKKIEDNVISEDQLKANLDSRYSKVVSDYNRNKGKAKAPIDISAIGDKIYYKIGKSLSINLILVKGELL
ncbi:hypothetical protein [Dysgonomonas sp. HGC4]|uniref:hypothetical protein n=1 Tax=Dysgonomonas sp. HGC4 TaxID=1658009 RepID=UPI0006811915|nr:hypothetical protein [Dysgonomonas sp. HGC4]MBD8349371.1 hypothetical protein [Dysgonomonas sp. HGC4]